MAVKTTPASCFRPAERFPPASIRDDAHLREVIAIGNGETRIVALIQAIYPGQMSRSIRQVDPGELRLPSCRAGSPCVRDRL
jgi:hypothetical protein